MVKIKQENDRLRNTVKTLNKRIGDQYVCGSSEESDSEIEDHIDVPESSVNTLWHQTDKSFASTMPYITNVSFFVQFCVSFVTNLIYDFRLLVIVFICTKQ